MYVVIFFHRFKIQNSLNYTNDFGLFSLWKHVWYFRTYSENMRNFYGIFYLVTSLIKEAYTKIFRLSLDSPSACSNTLHNY